jgi:hypothetical protein
MIDELGQLQPLTRHPGTTCRFVRDVRVPELSMSIGWSNPSSREELGCRVRA